MVTTTPPPFTSCSLSRSLALSLSLSLSLSLFSHIFFQHITTLPGVLYSYLAEGVGHSTGKGAFRALSRGYVHWASGRMEKLEVNYHNPTFCHVRCTMKPSMKDGSYTVYVLLEKSTQYTTTIRRATCQCTAG